MLAPLDLYQCASIPGGFLWLLFPRQRNVDASAPPSRELLLMRISFPCYRGAQGRFYLFDVAVGLFVLVLVQSFLAFLHCAR